MLRRVKSIFLLAPKQKLGTIHIRIDISQQLTDTETMDQSAES